MRNMVRKAEAARSKISARPGDALTRMYGAVAIPAVAAALSIRAGLRSARHPSPVTVRAAAKTH